MAWVDKDWPGISTGFVKIGIDWKGLGPVPIPRQSMTGEFALIHPPSRLGTIQNRALVPRLLRQMALSNGLKLALDCSRIGDTYANAVPIHLEVWLWAGRDYGVSLVQFILREDQLATRIEACSID